MNFAFPSNEFDEAVSAVCHDTVSEEQARALNVLLRARADARDEYLLRLELHSRLASDPDLFAAADQVPRAGGDAAPAPDVVSLKASYRARNRGPAWAAALAACFVLVAGGWWGSRFLSSPGKTGSTSNAVAMLDRVANAEWTRGGDLPRLGAPLEPGRLQLESGLAQVVFYSGARVAIQGPVVFELVSPNEAFLHSGRLAAVVPPQARGFRVNTARARVTDLGGSFGLEVADRRMELHVFEGEVEFLPVVGGGKKDFREGAGIVIEDARPPRLIAASPAAFASLFDLRTRSATAEAGWHDQWRESSERLHRDPSLLVHLDFQNGPTSGWRLRNASPRNDVAPEATMVGCQWTGGRWPGKRALEFQSVNDRVRVSVPGEYDSLTLAAWVRVQGLDRKINSLFMCDGFAAGTVHWLIRDDGVLGLTVIGRDSGGYQIVASPPVIGLDRFGMWLHLAVVIDGGGRRATHYVNGGPVAEKALRIDPPYSVGNAELGNWNARGFPKSDPFMIRNFSGAMDEFCLFSRALDDHEIRALYDQGKPEPEPLARR